MNEKRKGPLRRQLADRRTRGERRMELQRGFDREGRSDEDRRKGLERLPGREGRSGEDRDRAARNRDIAAKRMTPAQLFLAERLAQQWKPKK